MDLQPLDDRDYAIRTILGEAAGEPAVGQAAVAHVIKNRLEGGAYGNSLADVVTAPAQFSPWNRDDTIAGMMAYSPDDPRYQRAGKILDGVLGGQVPDPTGGATHFANVGTVEREGNKSGLKWIREMVDNGSAIKIGNHTFGRPDSAPGRKRSPADDFEVVASPDDFELVKTGGGVDVANTEADTQRLEAGMAGKSPTLAQDGRSPVPAANGPQNPAAAPGAALGGPEAANFADRFGPQPGSGEETGRRAELAAPLKAAADKRLAQADADLVGEGGAGNEALTGGLTAANTALFNLPRVAAAGIAAGAGALGVPGYSDRGFTGYYHRAKEQEAALERQNPKSAIAGTVAGAVGGGLLLPAPQMLTLGAMATKGALTAGGYSAGSALVDSLASGDDAGTVATKTAGAGVAGTALGAAFSPFAYVASKGIAKLSDRLLAAPAASVFDDAGALTPAARSAIAEAGIPDHLADAFGRDLQSIAATKGVNAAAAREALAQKYGVELSQGQATRDANAQQWERSAAGGGYGEKPRTLMGEFFDRQADQVGAAKRGVGEGLANGTPVESPAEAGQMIANRAAGSYSLARQVEGNALSDADRALGAVRGQVDGLDAGATVAHAVRDRAGQARAGYKARFDDAFSRDGTFEPGTFDQVGGTVRQALENHSDPVHLDPTNTPSALKALEILDQIPNLKLGGVAPQPKPRAGDIAPSSSAPGAQPLAQASLGGTKVETAPGVGEAVYTPAGRKVDVEYRVVDAGELVPSHTADLAPNPAYPALLQPRDRTRAASEAQIAGMARQLQPERLGPSASAAEGAPIVGPDGLVESGNGRVLAIRRAYSENGPSAKAYRDYLAAQGYETAGMAEPVLVRVNKTPMSGEERVAFAKESNASPTLSMGAAERASSDAERLGPDVLSLYKGGDVGSADNRDFVRAFVGRVAQKGEEGAIAAGDGSLSIEGAQRIRNALTHAAYGDSRLVSALAETGDDSIRSFGRVLEDVAGDAARVRQGVASGQVDAGADLSKPLLEAAQVVQAARAKGVPLAQAVAQTDAFSPISAEAQGVLRLVYGADLAGRVNRNRAGEALRGALADAEKQTGGANLFGEPPLTARQILEARAPTADAANAAQNIPGPERMSAAEFRALQAQGATVRSEREAAAAPAAPASKPALRQVLEAQAPPEMQSGPLELKGVDQARRRLLAAASAARKSGNATDLRAVSRVISEFDDQVERAISEGLFSGDPGALDALKGARRAFASYKRTFGPQGTGDDAGRVMQQIVERNAQPVEVANWLYGAGQAPGMRGVSTRLVDRLEGVLGTGSPEWQSIQQGLIGRIVNGRDTSHAAISDRIQRAMTGDGRDLVRRVLSDDQINGLRAFQRGVARAQATREGVPEWISGLADKGFEPRAVIEDLLGAGGVGGKVSSPDFARALRGYFGHDSAEWGAVRQAAWQHLTSKPQGVDDFGPQAMSQRIGQFLNGKGQALAAELYSPAERAQMAEFATLLKTVAPMPRTVNTSGSGDTAGAILQRVGDASHKLMAVLGGLGFMHSGPIGGAIAGGIGKVISTGGEVLSKRGLAKQAERAVAGSPALPAPAPANIGWPAALGLGTEELLRAR